MYYTISFTWSSKISLWIWKWDSGSLWGGKSAWDRSLVLGAGKILFLNLSAGHMGFFILYTWGFCMFLCVHEASVNYSFLKIPHVKKKNPDAKIKMKQHKIQVRKWPLSLAHVAWLFALHLLQLPPRSCSSPTRPSCCCSNTADKLPAQGLCTSSSGIHGLPPPPPGNRKLTPWLIQNCTQMPSLQRRLPDHSLKTAHIALWLPAFLLPQTCYYITYCYLYYIMINMFYYTIGFLPPPIIRTLFQSLWYHQCLEQGFVE